MSAKKIRLAGGMARIAQSDLVDVEGAAKMIFVSPKTIRNWLGRGRLTRLKAGRRTLVRISEVMALVKVA